MSSIQRTLPQMFEDSVAKYPNNILMWEKKTTQYIGSSYREIQKLVHRCAGGLIQMGINNGDRLALISEGRNYWVVSELGILFTGAINVPLSVKIDELSDLKFRIAHSGCRAVIVSGTQAHKVRTIKNDLPELEIIILLDGEPQSEDEITFEKLLELGQKYLAVHEDEFKKRW